MKLMYRLFVFTFSLLILNQVSVGKPKKQKSSIINEIIADPFEYQGGQINIRAKVVTYDKNAIINNDNNFIKTVSESEGCNNTDNCNSLIYLKEKKAKATVLILGPPVVKCQKAKSKIKCYPFKYGKTYKITGRLNIRKEAVGENSKLFIEIEPLSYLQVKSKRKKIRRRSKRKSKKR